MNKKRWILFGSVALTLSILVWITLQSAIKPKQEVILPYQPFNEKSLISDLDMLNQPEDTYLVYIYEDYCTPCEKYENEELKKYVKKENSLPLYKVNLDKRMAMKNLEINEWLGKYGLTHTPSVLVILDHKIVHHYQGPVPSKHFPVNF